MDMVVSAKFYITSGKSLYQPCSDHFDLKDLPAHENL